MQVSRLVLNSFLILMAIFSLWLVWYFAVDLNFQKPFNPNTPDEFGQEVKIVSMDKEGHWSYQFSSPFMQHIPAQNRSIFSAPVLELYQTKSPAWKITAKNGEALLGSQEIHLHDDVKAVQAKGLHNDSIEIDTSSAVIYPDAQIISSSDKVTAIRLDAYVESVGFQCSVRQKILTLLSKVHGVYYSQSKQQKPVDIISDKAVLSRTANTAIFEGDVKLTQDKNLVLTPLLTLYMDANDMLSKAIGKGPGTLYQTHKQPHQPPFLAKADEIQYFPRESIAVFKGNAKATQGENSYSAPEIRYHIDNNLVLSYGGRVDMVILPKSLKKTA